MADLDIEKLKQISEVLEKQQAVFPDLKYLKDALDSPFFGCDGGNIESPIWFCALEPGGGFNETTYKCIPEKRFYVDRDVERLPIDKGVVLERVNRIFEHDKDDKPVVSRSEIYQAYVLLLTTIITGQCKIDEIGNTAELGCLVNKFNFFSKGHYGFLLNAYPITMRSHDGAGWDKKTVESRYSSKPLISLQEWTGISFDDYRELSKEKRHKAFCSIRRKYHPKFIYCGGISDANRLFSMWTDNRDIKTPTKEKRFYLSDGKKLRLLYQWITDENHNDTLLAVGYSFFSSRASSCLGANLERCKTVGIFLREECERHFGNNFAWLDRKSFDPTYIKE